MVRQASETQYEVLCQRCQVSFPVGTRRCLHCGGRIGSRSGAAGASLGPPPPIGVEDAMEEGGSQRSGLLSPLAIIWLLLALGGTLYRACT